MFEDEEGRWILLRRVDPNVNVLSCDPSVRRFHAFVVESPHDTYAGYVDLDVRHVIPRTEDWSAHYTCLQDTLEVNRFGGRLDTASKDTGKVAHLPMRVVGL